MLTFTTSWDDGYESDVQTADLLDRYRMKGTFYVTREYTNKRLSDADIRALAARHEIGAHSLTHPDLPKLSDAAKREEIAGSKKWLEGLLDKEVSVFCYPSGHFDSASVAAVKAAGFHGARTTEGGKLRIEDSFIMPTTIQIYPFPLRKRDSSHMAWRRLLQPFIQRNGSLRELGVPYLAMRSWGAAARAAFDIARRRGGVFHLWGHSWELEKYGMWEDLEDFLRYASSRADAYVTNGELIR